MSAIDDVIKQIKRRLDEMIFNGRQPDSAFPSTVTATPSSSLTLFDVETAVAQLRALPPTVTDVWFIDRPDAYQWFVSEFPAVVAGVDTAVGTVSGIRVHDWYTRHFDPKSEVIADEGDSVTDMLRRSGMEKVIWPWVCRHPGVWFRWSNGRFSPVAIGDVTSMFNWARPVGEEAEAE